MLVKRCPWAEGASDLEQRYHDEEWGIPIHDDRQLFEALTLEGAQAGLSWRTILHKREGYRKVFAGFDVDQVACFDEAKQEALMHDSGIVRHRLKIRSTVNNARCILALQEEGLSFSDYLWSFTNHQTLQRKDMQLRTNSVESDAMSKELKKRGFKFVGSTICYAFMQATGMVNDHDPSCFRFSQ